MLTGVYPHMPILPMLHSQRRLTRHSVITGQFVTPDSRLSNAFRFLALEANPRAKFHQNRR